MIDYTIPACAAAMLSVTLTTLVVVDFFTYTSNAYRQRYLKEAAVELDDVLLQVPADKILDLSLALSGLIGFMAALVMGIGGSNWSWSKIFFLAFLTALISFPIPRVILRYLKRRRLAKFNEQLEDALLSISSSLKAGFSINQALEVIANENIRPISVEFRLLMSEIRLGVPLDDALYKMVRRLESDDFELVATAIITARQTGGELTAVLERLAAVIRERLRISGRLQALTAQGRLQAYVIGAMPFMLMFAMSFIAPAMMSYFFHSLLGIILIVFASVLIVVGFLLIRKITTIDI